MVKWQWKHKGNSDEFIACYALLRTRHRVKDISVNVDIYYIYIYTYNTLDKWMTLFLYMLKVYNKTVHLWPHISSSTTLNIHCANAKAQDTFARYMKCIFACADCTQSAFVFQKKKYIFPCTFTYMLYTDKILYKKIFF